MKKLILFGSVVLLIILYFSIEVVGTGKVEVYSSKSDDNGTHTTFTVSHNGRVVHKEVLDNKNIITVSYNIKDLTDDQLQELHKQFKGN